MIKMRAKLIIDFGNSDSRCRVKFTTSGDKVKEVPFNLSNYFATILGDYKVPVDYTSEDSTIFTIDKFVVDDEELSGTYVNGKLCEQEFRKVKTRPSANSKKYSSVTTALTFSLAVLKATECIASELGVDDLNDLDITWAVVALLPPEDMDKGVAKLESVFRSITKVEYFLHNVAINTKIDTVQVFPEGFCAYVGSVFKRGMQVRPEMMVWLKRTVLVVDIGAGTTDKIMISGAQVIDNSRRSDTIGGNQVASSLKKILRRELDLVLTEEAVQRGVLTGTVLDGVEPVDITPYVIEEKNNVATTEIGNLTSYFEEMQFPTRSIGGILVCGGGSMESENKNIPSIGSLLVKFLKTLAPKSELVPLPTDEEGVPLSPRELNIEGASILSEMNK